MRLFFKLNKLWFFEEFSRHVSYVLASFVILVSFPLLAHFPQGEFSSNFIHSVIDGAGLPWESFGLQYWLNRLIVLFPFSSPILALSFFSLLLHGLTIFLISEILALWGVQLCARVIATLSYGFFPEVWIQAVQPDPFPLCFFCMAFLIFCGTRLWQNLAQLESNPQPRHKSSQEPPKSLGLKSVILLALILGLSCAQSPVTWLVFPLFFLSLKNYFVFGKNLKLLELLVFFGISLLLPSLVFLSLPSFQNQAPYFVFSAATTSQPHSALLLISQSLVQNWKAFLLFVPMSWGFFKTNPASSAIVRAICFELFLTLILLFFLRSLDSSAHSQDLLARFAGLLLLPLVLLLGTGLHWSTQVLESGLARNFLSGLLLSLVLGMGLQNQIELKLSLEEAKRVYTSALLTKKTPLLTQPSYPSRLKRRLPASLIKDLLNM